MILLFVIVLLFTTCINKPVKKEEAKKTVQTENLEKPAYTLLFDGQTLNNWEVTNFGPQGPVDVSGGKIVLGMGDGCTGVNWTGEFLKVNYEVIVDAMRISGNDFFCGLTFPVKDDFCSLIIGGWGGVVCGLSTINRMDGSENETTLIKAFNKNEWYKVKLRVTEEKIEAWVNDEQIVDFTLEGKEIGIRPEVNLSKPFGICSWQTTAAVRNIYLKQIEGNND